jgi:hypothetical protein
MLLHTTQLAIFICHQPSESLAPNGLTLVARADIEDSKE